MSKLFEPITIRDLTVRNRFMRSATTSAFSNEDGTVNDSIVKLYERLSLGEVGLIVKGHLYVHDGGKGHPGMAGISHDYHVPHLKRLTDAVHRHGGHIAAQINHAGVAHQPDRAGPSAYKEGDWDARELTVDEIEGIIEAFGDAAERALQAGFDAVQIHGAHGYLVSQFLSPLVNKRRDKWGGSPENRMRFLKAVYDEVRGRMGNEPLMIKINSDDFAPGGFTVEDSVEVCRALSGWGIDLIEVSGGGRGSVDELRSRAAHSDPGFSEAAFAGHGARIKEAIGSTPMALVYGFRRLETMERAVDVGLTDMVSLSRPFIREPGLVRSLRQGQSEATCIRCDACRENFGKAMMQCLLE